MLCNMSPLAWLVVFFFLLLFICLVVYVLVVRAFYWGGKEKTPEDAETARRGDGKTQ